MQNAKLIYDFWEHLNNCEWDQAKVLLDSNFVAEWPQSRVRFHGPHNFIMMNANYPGEHNIKVIDVYDFKNKIISEVEIHSKMPDGMKIHLYAISIFEVHKGKLLKSTGEFVGQCGLFFQSDIDGKDEIEVGYLFVRKFWHQGLATEAAKGTMKYAREQLGFARLISLIRPENTPSRRVADRNGLIPEKEIDYKGYRHIVYVSEKPSDQVVT